jgi:hypothetical protein
MRFVPVKTAEQQAALMLHRSRDLLVRHAGFGETLHGKNSNARSRHHDTRASNGAG